MAGEGIPQKPAVLGQRTRVRLRTQLVQKLRRAFYVGEEERDGSGREVAPHGVMMRERKP